MDLKGRLGLIADMVPQCDVVCDIGTDHAYIPIYLVMNNRCKRAVASDIRKGPIKVADKNIEKYNLRNYIDTRVGNGLETVRDGEEDTIIIAGMGGYLISRIIGDGLNKVTNCDNIVLQPMNELECLRKWLYETGFDILDEELAREGEKIYNVIVAKWIGKPSVKDEVYYHFGEKLFERRDPLLKDFILKKINTYNKIVLKMENMGSEKDELRQHYSSLIDRFKKMAAELD